MRYLEENDEKREQKRKEVREAEYQGIYLTLNQYCLPPNEVRERNIESDFVRLKTLTEGIFFLHSIFFLD